MRGIVGYNEPNTVERQQFRGDAEPDDTVGGPAADVVDTTGDQCAVVASMTFQKCDDCQNPPVIIARLAQLELCENVADVFFDRALFDP